MRYSVKVNEKKTEYIKFGTGERNLVILPGLSLKCVLDDEKAIEQAYSAFCEDFTVYLFDRIRDMPADYTLYEMARDTADAIKAAGIESARFYGVSQGGMLAMIIAAENPPLVQKLAVCSTCAKSDERTKEVISRWVDLAESGDAEALAENMVNRIFSEDTVGKYGDWLKRMYAGVSEAELERFARTAAPCIDFDFTDLVRNVQCAALVIGTEGDRVIPFDLIHKTSQMFPFARFGVIDNCGHAVYDEAPYCKEMVYMFLKELRL